MPDKLPARRINREALERIIQRAAELQAGEMDTGEELTEPELLRLGAEVGIDGRFLRRAMYEEFSGGAAAERGFLAKWIGPGRVSASRVVPGDRATVEQAVATWMAEGEAMAVKRRLPDATVWEPQRGFFAEMKRGFGVGGRSYELAKARDVTVSVTQLEPGYCHVEVSADIGNSRFGAATAGGVLLGVFGGFGAAVLGFFSGPPLGLLVVGGLPLVGGLAAPIVASAAHRRRAAHVQLGLEQLLDRLEHGEIKPRHRTGRTGIEDLGAQLFGRVSSEIRKALGERPGESGASRRLPP
jgi:hypothetical protein